MTQATLLRDRLWGVFRLLEMANVEAIRTKRQLALIADFNPQGGGDVDLLPYRFHIDGHVYGALVTDQQRDQILLTIGKGSAEDVLTLIAEDFLEGHLYAAVNQINAILISALTNQDLVAQSRFLIGPAVQPPVGACKFPDGSCQSNCGAPLCKTLGGVPCASCTEFKPDDSAETIDRERHVHERSARQDDGHH